MEIVAAIRSKLEGLLSVSSSTATLQLAVLHPVLQSLSHVSPRLEGAVADPENAFRGAVLELLGRLPVAEVPKPNIPDLITACHHVLTDDHEDNGAVAQRVLFDVHKAYKQALEESTSPFFEWLKTLFEGLGGAASSQLEAAAKADPNGPRPLLAAKESMKIAQEVALMVFFLFQSYPKRLAQYGPTLLPLMISVAAIPGPELADVPPAAMPAYTEFRMAQIKTMLFVIALSRSQVVAQVLTPHKEEVCSALVRLMVTAPNSLALRKELLNCMRNMLPTPFREGLQANIDTFLDPGVLLGASQGGSDTLRQAAYMHLAELIAATKGELTLDQLRRIVQVYTHNATDVNSPITLQTTSVRLLYNLIEVLFARRGKDIATAEACRAMLASILDCMVAKLGMLRDAVPFHINILREMEDTRKERKAKEAAIAADCEAAGKRSIAARRKRLREEVAEHEKKAQANAAAVPMATDEPVKAEGAPESTEAAAPGGAPAAEAMEVDVKPEAAAADAGAGELAAGETKPAEEKEQEKDKDAEDEELLVPADAPPSPEPFRLQFQSPTITSNREREMLDFRNLLHTVISCLKNVLYITVAFHTNRGLQTPMTFTVKPWTSRPADIRGVADILTLGFQAISFYEEGMAPLNWNAREVFADLFTVLTDPREFAEIFAPRMSFLYDLVLAKHWYMHSFRHLLEGENAKRSFVDRSAAACYLRFLVSEKLHTLDDPDSPEGKLTIEWLEMCFDALPRIQPLDLHKAPQLAQHGLMSIEKAVLPHIVALLRALYPKLAAGGPTARGPTHVMRSLFYALAVTNKFQDIQAAVGQSGLHARIVDATLGILQGPSASTKEEEEAAAELCLLVPARLEHLIPLLPRMMHAAVRALTGSDRSVGVALRVLDVWVESFNPEFIERSMAAVMKPLMAALWSHIRPPPHPFGAKVAEMLGKMGGRGRRWLGDSVSVEYKAIPEYGLRVILAFPPHTSFLVPLDRCVQLAWASMESSAHEIPRRKNALRLLQICFGSLARLSLPADMLVALPAPEPTVAPEEAEPAAAAAPEGAEAAAAADAASAGEGTDTSPTEPAVRQPAAEAAPPKTVLCDDALGRLQALLFGNGKVPQIPPDFQWPNELGVKTKKQHTAEKQMLETVLTALMASVALDKELEGAKAKEFAFATCRHFALLLASGWAATAVSRWDDQNLTFGGCTLSLLCCSSFNCFLDNPPPALYNSLSLQTPPPAPPSSKVTKYGVRGGIPAHVATLKHLQPHVLLDAFQQGLKQNSAAARAAVVECMEVFLDTLVEVGEVQLRERKKKKEAEKEVDKEKEKAKEKEKESAEEDDPVNPAVPDPKAKLSDTMPYLNVQQDLVMRAMHCCYGDNWPTRLGGVAALKALASRMPHEWLMRAANYLTKALMAVLRTLPDNAVKEQEDITAILLDIVRRALNLPAESKTTEEQQQQAGQSGGEDDAPTNMEVEPEEETAAQTGKRGKRTKRGGPQPARKRQQREEDASPSGKDATPPANAQPGKDGSEGDGPREDESMPDGIRRLQNDLLQAVMSSKSNDAVRAAATQCLQLLAQNAKTSVGAMFSQMLSRQPSSRTLLERRMLPLRSIATQTNYAHSTAFLLRSCPEQLELTPSLATFVADSCTLMELDDQMLGSSVTVRGQPPKADVITKLQVACMEVLVAALNWPAFRDAKDQNVGNHNWAAPGEVAVPVQHLRDRIMKAFIRRLGSTSERVVALSVEGIETILKHKMLEKNMLQEALRPILMDLAVYQRMTLHLLRHVHRLLVSLANNYLIASGFKHDICLQ